MTHEVTRKTVFSLFGFAWKVLSPLLSSFLPSGMFRFHPWNVKMFRILFSSFEMLFEKYFYEFAWWVIDVQRVANISRVFLCFFLLFLPTTRRMSRSGWTWSSRKTAFSTGWEATDSSRSPITFSCSRCFRVSTSLTSFNPVTIIKAPAATKLSNPVLRAQKKAEWFMGGMERNRKMCGKPLSLTNTKLLKGGYCGKWWGREGGIEMANRFCQSPTAMTSLCDCEICVRHRPDWLHFVLAFANPFLLSLPSPQFRAGNEFPSQVKALRARNVFSKEFPYFLFIFQSVFQKMFLFFFHISRIVIEQLKFFHHPKRIFLFSLANPINDSY